MRKLMLFLIGVFALFNVISYTGCSSINDLPKTHEVSIILWKGHMTGHGTSDIVIKTIMEVTDSEYVHVGIQIGEYMYESNLYGSIKTKHIFEETSYRKVIPIAVSETQYNLMEAKANYYTDKQIPYNYYLLFKLASLYDKRDGLRTEDIPYDNEFWGFICSVQVRLILLAGGIDFFGDLHPYLTVPEDYAKYVGGYFADDGLWYPYHQLPADITVTDVPKDL